MVRKPTRKKKSTVRRRTTKKKKRAHDLVWMQWFTLFVGIIAVILIGGVILFITTYKNTSRGIDLNITQETKEVGRGVPLEISININNQTGSTLSNTELTLRLSQGLINLDFTGEKDIIKDVLGNIGKGSLTKRTYKLLPISELGSKETLTATLMYTIGKTEFETEYVHDITVAREALEVSIETPEQILGGSEFEFIIHYHNISDFDFSSLTMELSYPQSFTFISSDFPPDTFSNIWNLGSLRAGSDGDLTVRGFIEGSLDSPLEISLALLADFVGQPYCIAEVQATLTTAQSPLGLSIFISGAPQGIARIGNVLTYTISYHNRSGIALRDVNIKAEFVGEIFDFGTLTADAKLNMFTNTLMWDETTTPSLKLLEPNDQGRVTAAIRLKRSFPISRMNDKNFALHFTAHIESPSVPYYLQTDTITATTKVVTKLAGLVYIEAQVLYRDASSGILNLGTLPPTVGRPTQYTVHWVIRNHATDIRDTKASAYLPQGVRWTGMVKSNIDSVPLYDEATRDITWNIEYIPATKGVISAPIEGIFQIEVLPTHSFIGQFHPLLTDTTLTAIDDFTGITLTSLDSALNTALPDDPTVSTISGIVIE